MIAFARSPAFKSLDELLDWSERHGQARPVVERGPDGTYRGSVETAQPKTTERKEDAA